VGARDVSAPASTGGLPSAFVERLTEILPPEHLGATLRSFAEPAGLFTRGNTLRGSSAEARAALLSDGIAAEPVAWMAEGLRLHPSERDRLVRHPAVEDGRLYVQGASSWLAVLALRVEPGHEVLDLAAAPGGKASHIAAIMQNRGRLACVEPVRGRFFRLKANLDRCGVTIAQLYLKDGRGVGRAVPDRFDRVMLDAPCSSEARFRAGDPETFRHWSERKIREASRKQRGLIRSGFAALKPGGRMVYATCSLAPEENEAIVDELLRVEAIAEVVPFTPPDTVASLPGLPGWRSREFHASIAFTRRILPRDGLTAFYVAVIEKRAG